MEINDLAKLFFIHRRFVIMIASVNTYSVENHLHNSKVRNQG
jgi:hypothetical protein